MIIMDPTTTGTTMAIVVFGLVCELLSLYAVSCELTSVVGTGAVVDVIAVVVGVSSPTVLAEEVTDGAVVRLGKLWLTVSGADENVSSDSVGVVAVDSRLSAVSELTVGFLQHGDLGNPSQYGAWSVVVSGSPKADVRLSESIVYALMIDHNRTQYEADP